MLELELGKKIETDTGYPVYVAMANASAEKPYIVLETVISDAERVSGDKVTRYNTTIRAYIYGGSRQACDNISRQVIKSINYHRGALGDYKDVYVTCDGGKLVTENGLTYRNIIDIDIINYGV